MRSIAFRFLLPLFPTLFTFVAGTPTDVEAFQLRDSLVTNSPVAVNATGIWTLIGCFTDISTSRTLSATSTAATNMTVEACVAFCGTGDFIYAGVEFSTQCYCDSTIQIPGAPSPSSDCNMACAGNSSEICGGSSEVLIYTNGEPAPIIVQDVGQWSYEGCFTDNVLERVLTVAIEVPAGVTAETCTAGCKTAGFSIAGLEDGQECWCGNTIGNNSLHVDDDDCRELCISDHNEYCGNANRLAIYEFAASGAPPPPTTCATNDITNFTLVAIPEDDSPPLPLKIIVVEMVPGVTWTILTACPLCCTDWPTYSLQNSVFLPQSLSNPGQLMVSSAPGPGQSPNFVASDPPFPGFQSYCATNSTSNTPPLLGFGGITNGFALCTNTSVDGGGRLDVVYEPQTNNLNYVSDDCVAVSIEVIVG